MNFIKRKEYPKYLQEIYDPPAKLYYQGQLEHFKNTCISIVGTRKNTPYGHEVTEKIIQELSSFQITIVSGLALGIDTIAHKAALKFGLPTVAVLGSGLSHIYPKNNRNLAKEISQRGLLLSEYPPETPPFKQHFPARNRIVSGLSIATIVIEAPLKSGALITAKFALDQGREVFTIPGDIDRQNFQGNLMLLQKGWAHPIASGLEIVEILGKLPPKKSPQLQITPSPQLQPTQNQILSSIPKNRAISIDHLIEKILLPTSKVLAALSLLEISGLIKMANNKVKRLI